MTDLEARVIRLEALVMRLMDMLRKLETDAGQADQATQTLRGSVGS